MTPLRDEVIGDSDEIDCAWCGEDIRPEAGDGPPKEGDELECPKCELSMKVTDTRVTVTVWARPLKKPQVPA